MSKKHNEESRSEQYLKSAKQGALKESLDMGLQEISAPLVKIIGPAVGSLTDSDMADPFIKASLEFAVMQFVAEVFVAGGHFAHKIPGLDLSEDDAKERMEAIGGFIRVYSGDRLGDKAAQKAIEFLPIVKKLLTDASMAGIFGKAKALSLPPSNPNLYDLLDEDAE